MKLQTREFGSITFEPHEVLRIQGIDSERAEPVGWLLLADRMHPHLYWLQGVSDSTLAIPLCGLSHLVPDAVLRLSRDATPADWESSRSLIVLAEIRRETDLPTPDLQRLILIDPHGHRGIRVILDSDQALQRAPSEKVAPLRKCA